MIFSHAVKRAMERFPGVCPGLLVREIRRDFMKRDEGAIELIGRMRPSDLNALYRFKTSAGQVGYAIICEPTGFIVTLLNFGRNIRIERGYFYLGRDGLESPMEVSP